MTTCDDEPQPLGLSRPPATCAYFSMIRQLDNIKFALLLPEFVYGRRRGGGQSEGKRRKAKGGSCGRGRHQPTYGRATNTARPRPVHQCNLMSGTQPHPSGLATIKVIEKYFPSHFVRQRKGKRVYFFFLKYPGQGGVYSGDGNVQTF